MVEGQDAVIPTLRGPVLIACGAPCHLHWRATTYRDRRPSKSSAFVPRERIRPAGDVNVKSAMSTIAERIRGQRGSRSGRDDCGPRYIYAKFMQIGLTSQAMAQTSCDNVALRNLRDDVMNSLKEKLREVSDPLAGSTVSLSNYLDPAGAATEARRALSYERNEPLPSRFKDRDSDPLEAARFSLLRHRNPIP
jgi:hypothetical protein